MSRRKRALDGLDDDIRDHLQRETQDNIARGMSPEDAHRSAVLKFGSIAAIKEDTRAVWGWQRIAQLKQDIRYAARALRRRPAYALLSILTLALGIGSTACVYGVARGVLFTSLPFRNERDVGVFWKKQDWSHQEYLFIRGHVPGFSQVALYRAPHVIMRDADRPAQLVQSVFASAELFDVLGVAPLLGRGFRDSDNLPGGEPIAIVSFALWQELGGTPGVVGSRLTLDGTTRTIVGVMPRGFWFPNPSVRLWMPERLNPESRIFGSTLVGRVAPHRDVNAMDAPVAQLTRMLRERFDYPSPQWDKTRDAHITPVREDILGPMQPAVLATLGGMAVILLIACANVGALTLGYVSARSPEFAVRAALGANRGRLARQLVSEVLVVTTLAGIVGAALAWVAFPAIVGALPLGVWADSTRPDWSVVTSAMAIALAAAVPVMLVPAVSLLRGDLHGVLTTSRTVGLEGRGGRLENGLVIAQVALAVMLAAGSALLARSVTNLYRIEPGVATSGVAMVDVVLRSGNRTRREQTLNELAAALHALPGVRSVGTVQTPPLRDRNYRTELTIDGHPEIQGGITQYRIITPGYFESIGIPVRRGRAITDADDRNAERVVVVNEAFVQKYLGGADPIGMLVGGDLDTPARVVGVVGNAAETSLTAERQPTRYVPRLQVPWIDDAQSFVIRVAAGIDETALLESARRIVATVAPGAAIQQATTMRRVLETAIGPARQVVMLLTLLTTLALVLGAVGVYGVIAQFAARHRREWAIRVALGLEGSQLIGRVLRHGAALVCFGIALGMAGALGLTRLLSSFLYGVSAIDPLAFAAAGTALLAVGIVAALLPAWRAGRADPLIALREQ